VEQNPNEWWDKAKKVMQLACRDAKTSKISFITVTTSASCLVCMDRDGDTLGNALMVSDKRAEKESQYIKALPEFENVRQKTGLDMATSLMLPKILWIKNNRPEIFEKIEYFLTPNDYLVYKICDRCVTDYFNALKYHYQLEEKSYPKELLDIIGIQMSKFPNVINPGEEAGTINSKLADEIGINHDAKVIVSSYDAICSFVGSGVSEEGEASDVSGTVTVFRTYTKKNVNKSTKIYQVPLYSEQANIVGGSNNLGGGLIEWVKQCYYTKEEYPYEIMEKDARESEIGAKGLIFLPYLLGERAPLWDDNARGVFFGLERMHTRKDMTRAVFESTGFIDMDMIEAVNETGVDVESVRLSGGLARLNLVSQIKSDILGRDVLVLSEFETTSSGAAMMVLIGQGIYSNQKEAAVKFANIRMIIKPNMENHKKYQYMYGLYKDTYQSLKGLFVRRTHILEEIRSGREVKIENL
jgi:xylulokinase